MFGGRLGNDYVATAEIAAINENMGTIILFEEDTRLANGAYVEGEYDPADPDAAEGLKTKIGWDPRSPVEGVTYIVSAVSTTGFTISAEDSSGTELHSKNYCRVGSC